MEERLRATLRRAAEEEKKLMNSCHICKTGQSSLGSVGHVASVAYACAGRIKGDRYAREARIKAPLINLDGSSRGLSKKWIRNWRRSGPPADPATITCAALHTLLPRDRFIREKIVPEQQELIMSV